MAVINRILEIRNKYSIRIDDVMINAIKRILGNKYGSDVEFEMKNIFTFGTDVGCWQDEFDKIIFEYNANDDFLGALYMSLLSVGDRGKNGIFYTPSKIVDQALLSISDISKLDKILDPDCGSGNFIIKLYNNLKDSGVKENDIVSRLYGYEIDKIAVFLAKINIYKLTSNTKFSEINMYCKDFVLDADSIKFDLIIGNPPWGKKYNKHEIELFSNQYNSDFAKSDSFAQLILSSFYQLNTQGQLIFILPSSILNIAKHENIRKEILNKQLCSLPILVENSVRSLLML